MWKGVLRRERRERVRRLSAVRVRCGVRERVRRRGISGKIFSGQMGGWIDGWR